MKNEFNFDLFQIQSYLSGKALLKGTFGIEREGLRVKDDGNLAMTPHPSVFGNKLTNPYIKTDFSESQLEVVTPICDTVDEAYRFLSGLSDIIEDELPDNEYFWPQSMPCAISSEEEIPIAKYEGDHEKAKEAMAYRQGLIEKYGGKKQLISGIHYNLALDEDIIEALYKISPNFRKNNSEEKRLFKDQVYLKIIRGYLRYRWLIIYLTGCSVGCHKSFLAEHMKEDLSLHFGETWLQTSGPSLRNSKYGYKNLKPLFPRYDSVRSYTADVIRFISEGLISSSKELYTQIRMKSKDPAHLIDSLLKEGIQYLELRTVDINVFDPCGISIVDMTFIHHFILWLLTVSENQNDDWQEEALYNEEITALKGFDQNTVLYCNGKPVYLRDWAEKIMLNMLETEKKLDLGEENVIETMFMRIKDPNFTYASRLSREIEEKGYLESQLEYARMYKKHSQKRETVFSGCIQYNLEKQKKIKAALTTGNEQLFRELTGK